MSLATDIACNLTRDAIAEARRVIGALGPIEPDLTALPERLEAVPFATFVLTRCASAWRGLYLSIFQPPRRVMFVGSIDDAPELAGLTEGVGGLLIVETDTTTVSVAELLPRGTEWRSLAEFGTELDMDDRTALATAVVNGLQPEQVLVLGSLAGWEMLKRHGSALSGNAKLAVGLSGTREFSSTELLRRYLPGCWPAISALYAHEERTLQRVAALFGLTVADRGKLRDWRDAHTSDGFFATSEGDR